MAEAFFWGTAGLAVVTAVAVVMARDTVNSALFLIVHLLAQAVLFLLLNAQFVAAVQVVVYAGAIMVLFLFVIMMLGIERGEDAVEKVRIQRPLALLMGVTLVAIVGIVLSQTQLPQKAFPDEAISANTEAVGRLLFSDYLLAFEITSILLLVAIIGAVVLAQRKP